MKNTNVLPQKVLNHCLETFHSQVPNIVHQYLDSLSYLLLRISIQSVIDVDTIATFDLIT